MRRVEELLRDADPLRHEPPETAEDRAAIRRAILAAASRAGADRERFATLRASVALIVLVLLFVGVGARFWPRTTDVSAAVRFEVRLAEDQFSPGLRQAPVAGSNRLIYLHQEIVATNDDIAQSDLIESDVPSHFWIRVAFTSAGAARMQRATAGHLGAPMAILIDGEVVLAPTLRAPITTSAVISGDYTKAEAERIVRGMSVR